MADAYDYYRLNQQAYTNPWALSADPNQPGSPSQSLWGHIRKPLMGGLGGGMAGSMSRPMTMLGPTGALTGFLGANGAQAFGGMNEIKNGKIFENLGNGKNWKDFGTLGMSKSKRQAEEARAQRRSAVANWRLGNETRMGTLLAQQGQDVQADLGSALHDALWTGGAEGDLSATKDALTAFGQQYSDYMLGRQRAGQARQVDEMFADPSRTADRNKRLDASRTQGLADIADTFRTGQRNNAINQARRGTQGSSMDVEQQGDLSRTRDASALSLQNNLANAAQQYRLNDANQKTQLKGLIYADDANTAASYQRALDSLNTESQQLDENLTSNRQLSAATKATSQNYSQGVGNLLTSASQPLGYYLEHRGAGA